MATFTLDPDSRFHVGATVYLWRGGGLIPINPSPVTNATVAADSTTTFTGLAEGVAYMAGLTIAGPFVSFSTPPSSNPDDGTGSTGNVAAIRWGADEGWPERPDVELVFWIAPSTGDYADPTALMHDSDILIASALP